MVFSRTHQRTRISAAITATPEHKSYKQLKFTSIPDPNEHSVTILRIRKGQRTGYVINQQIKLNKQVSK